MEDPRSVATRERVGEARPSKPMTWASVVHRPLRLEAFRFKPRFLLDDRQESSL